MHLGELNGNTLTLHQSEGSGTPSLVQLQLNENLSNPRAGIVFWKAVVVTDAADDTSLVGDQWATWIGKTYNQFSTGGFGGKILFGGMFFGGWAMFLRIDSHGVRWFDDFLSWEPVCTW